MDGWGPLHLFMQPLSVATPHGLCSRVARLLLGGLSLLGAQRQKLPGYLSVRQKNWHSTASMVATLHWESQGNPDSRGQDAPSEVCTLGNKVQLRPPVLQTSAAFIWERFSQKKRKTGKWESSSRSRWLYRDKAKIYDNFLDGILGLKVLEILQEH